jgi:hypothetical protein
MMKWVARAACRVGQLGLLVAELFAVPDCGPKQECLEGQSRCGSPQQTETCVSHWPDGQSEPSLEWRAATVCDAERTCVMIEPMTAKCVQGGQQDPACAQAARHCDGDTVVTCAAGYGVDPKACGTTDTFGASSLNGGVNATRCIPSASLGATCIPRAATLDATCAGSSGPHCDGTTLVECVEEYAVFRANCQSCTIVPSPASCSGCAPALGQCLGYLGDACRGDSYCAASLVCHVEPGGARHCSTPCTVIADANASAPDPCSVALGAGVLPLSSYAEIAPTGAPLGSGGGSFGKSYPELAASRAFVLGSIRFREATAFRLGAPRRSAAAAVNRGSRPNGAAKSD